MPKQVHVPRYHLHEILFFSNSVAHHNICNLLLSTDLKCSSIIFYLKSQDPLQSTFYDSRTMMLDIYSAVHSSSSSVEA